jgi:hypothetical protein
VGLACSTDILDRETAGKKVVLKQTGELELQEYADWIESFLRTRGLSRANGEMLFAYRATRAEYLSLKAVLARTLECLNGAPWTLRSAPECACFVLYASEWWRRAYTGGPWRWTNILQSLGQPFSLDVIERTSAVERGLRAWGHRPGGQGKKYLGAIVAHGGLPLQLIARGDGSIARLLIRAMRQAQRYGWASNRLEGFFDAHQLELVQHLRDDDIYRLLASVVVTVLSLRQECQLAGVANPVEVLDRLQPNWRERFPIAVDDNSAEPLLVGLVKEAAKEYAAITSFPVIATRSLHLGDDGETYGLAMTAEMPGSITLDALSSAIGLNPDALPQSFSIDLLGGKRVSLGEGRQLLGGSEPTAVLSGRTRRVQGDAALAEHLLVLRCLGEDLHAPAEVPGAYALDEVQPWVFAARDTGLVLAGVGGCRVPEDTCLVAVPDDLKMAADGDGSTVDLKGLIGGLSQTRWVYQVRGAVRIIGYGSHFVVRSGQTSDLSSQLLWRGTRAPYRSGSISVYLGVPLLWRLATDGALAQVSTRFIEWAMPGKVGERVEQPRQHRGPIDAWFIEDGTRQRRFRMVLLPPEAKLRFRSGATECEGAIEFHAWGIESIDAPKELRARTDPLANGLKLELHAEVRPPIHVPVTVNWPHAPYGLRLDLPFPATGGRFTTAEGVSLQAGQAVPIRQLQSVRVQVFDRNPDAPKRYSLMVELPSRDGSSGVGRLYIEHSIPIDKQGFGELRLLEVESSLLGLLCQSSQLDARLELRLTVNGASISKIDVTRYDAALEPQHQSQTMTLPGACLARLSAEESGSVNLRALPLLQANAEEVELRQSQSEGTPTGRWSVASLSAERGPWMVYPSSTSTLQLRPTVYAGFAIGAACSRTVKICPLGEAMAIADADDRAKAIRQIVTDMAQDLDHESWLLITRQYQLLSHLPLSTFDYWRALASSMPSSLSALLKLSHDVHSLVKRMRNELGVVWELMPRTTLAEGLSRLQKSWAKQLTSDAGNPVVKTLSEQVFRTIGASDPLLDDLIELVLFQAGFNRTDKLDQIIAPFSTGARPLVTRLWLGENSMLQRFLLRTHTEERVWPHFDLSRALIKLLLASNPEAASKIDELCGRDLVWMPTAGQAGPHSKNIKEDVANAPVLAGLVSQLIPAGSPWWTASQLAQLRQIRNFDPAWFELGCRTGLLLALIVEQQLAQTKLHAASGHSSTPSGAQNRPMANAPIIRRAPRSTGSA